MYNDDRLTIQETRRGYKVQDYGLDQQLGFQISAKGAGVNASKHDLLH